MPAEKYILPDRAAWLAARKNHIGGSDATVCVEWYIGYSYSREAIRKWDSISVTGVAAGYG